MSSILRGIPQALVLRLIIGVTIINNWRYVLPDPFASAWPLAAPSPVQKGDMYHLIKKPTKTLSGQKSSEKGLNFLAS